MATTLFTVAFRISGEHGDYAPRSQGLGAAVIFVAVTGLSWHERAVRTQAIADPSARADDRPTDGDVMIGACTPRDVGRSTPVQPFAVPRS